MVFIDFIVGLYQKEDENQQLLWFCRAEPSGAAKLEGPA